MDAHASNITMPESRSVVGRNYTVWTFLVIGRRIVNTSDAGEAERRTTMVYLLATGGGAPRDLSMPEQQWESISDADLLAMAEK